MFIIIVNKSRAYSFQSTAYPDNYFYFFFNNNWHYHKVYFDTEQGIIFKNECERKDKSK